ncbi:helix-turn-helix domain-containing protein [Marinobacter sp. F4206]|uniref:helix-turn-helix domain-containing protein n=1 Tax=Marinobacter sp. F4206 TaxID=2861777 RepID=UPI001C5EF5B2|nr:helix-turn-helix domain-containing protein [Marinobacter sp. F4206]MBW4934468.1 helix-turn-helix domain-containing protein [Marinobacter sp. F4206]
MGSTSPSARREPGERVKRLEKIVRIAEGHFVAASNRPLSLRDLCAATGVGKGTLYSAFHLVCGAPPMAYFRKLRLIQARIFLLTSEPSRGRVKQAALNAGFVEFGRFAVEYRKAFGESPSSTLNRFQD